MNHAASLQADPAHTPEWRVSDGLVPYEEAISAMEQRVAAIRAGSDPEHVWLLEHPPLYTAGTSTKAADKLYQSGLLQITYCFPRTPRANNIDRSYLIALGCRLHADSA